MIKQNSPQGCMDVQYSQIDKHNLSHKQNEGQNHMIISIDGKKHFTKPSTHL